MTIDLRPICEAGQRVAKKGRYPLLKVILLQDGEVGIR